MTRCSLCGITDDYPFLRRVLRWQRVAERDVCGPECATLEGLRQAAAPDPAVIWVDEIDGRFAVEPEFWAAEWRREE